MGRREEKRRAEPERWAMSKKFDYGRGMAMGAT